MKTLIIGSDLNGLGGVQNYYRLVLPAFPESVEYFPVGRMSRSSRIGLGQLIEDMRRFSKTIHDFDVVVLNPSLCARCFFRDIPFLMLAKKHGVRTIVFFRGWRQRFEVLVERGFMPFFKWFYTNVDAMLVLSSAFESKLRSWGYENPIYLERTVVEDSWFASDVPDRTGDGPLNILFLSRVEDYKGIYELADGLAQLPSGTFTCVFAGDGSGLPAFKNYVEEKGYGFFEFPGYLSGEEKRKAYREADVYILPSHTEGMPNSLLEAMAAGLPCVVSAVGGIPDFFEDGKMGVLLKEIKPEAIAVAIRKIQSNRAEAEKMGCYNRTYASEYFRASNAARRLAGICKNTVGENGE